MRRFYSLLMLLALLVLPVYPLRQDAQQSYLAFIHVSVIDATGAPTMPDMTVVIVGDRITEIGKTGEIILPERARVIDATGKFLIPGLWDMHVHLLCRERVENFFPFATVFSDRPGKEVDMASAGAKVFLPKPYTADKLLNALAEVLTGE
jgi:hypothetical protein